MGDTGIATSFDKLGMAGGVAISPSPQPSPIEGDGEGTGFYLDEQDERDVQDFWVRGWRDCRGAALFAMVWVAGVGVLLG